MKHNKRLTALLAGMLAVSMLFTGCGGSNSGASDTGLIDGTYEGTGAGYGGNIKLALTVEGGKITKAEVLGAQRDRWRQRSCPGADPGCHRGKAGN